MQREVPRYEAEGLFPYANLTFTILPSFSCENATFLYTRKAFCYNEWKRVVEAPTPTKEKVMPLKIPQTAVGEGLAPPAKNNRLPNPIDPSKMLQRMGRTVEDACPYKSKGFADEILLTLGRGRRPRRPA